MDSKFLKAAAEGERDREIEEKIRAAVKLQAFWYAASRAEIWVQTKLPALIKKSIAAGHTDIYLSAARCSQEDVLEGCDSRHVGCRLHAAGIRTDRGSQYTLTIPLKQFLGKPVVGSLTGCP